MYMEIKLVFFSHCDYFQVDKVVQMYETMLTRHTTMVVGPTGGGKSVVINTLAQAQTKYCCFFITSLTVAYFLVFERCISIFFFKTIQAFLI